MSDRRRRYREWETLDVLIIQGVVIPCYRCGKPILSGKNAQREHLHELALGGREAPENCRYSHVDCHAIVTDGPPATSAGSSKQRIAKTRRLEKQRTGDGNAVRAVLGSTFRALNDSRPKPTNTIKSRGFQTNKDGPFKQTMRGRIVRREQ